MHYQINSANGLDKANFKSEGLTSWKGTAVGIDISMDVNQDFKDLLEMILTAYHLDIKRANKDKYHKPKFL